MGHASSTAVIPHLFGLTPVHAVLSRHGCSVAAAGVLPTASPTSGVLVLDGAGVDVVEVVVVGPPTGETAVQAFFFGVLLFHVHSLNPWQSVFLRWMLQNSVGVLTQLLHITGHAPLMATILQSSASRTAEDGPPAAICPHWSGSCCPLHVSMSAHVSHRCGHSARKACTGVRVFVSKGDKASVGAEQASASIIGIQHAASA
jgi:hypothetical protein